MPALTSSRAPLCPPHNAPQVATLRSAVKLEQEQQFLIAKKLQELSGSKNIKLKPTIDPSVIAGFIVEYGSSQIDMSVRGQVVSVSQEEEGGDGRGGGCVLCAEGGLRERAAMLCCMHCLCNGNGCALLVSM